MAYIIFGGSGFVGRYLVEELSKKDFDKICFSDIAQKWFLDVDFSDEFSEFMVKINDFFKFPRL